MAIKILDETDRTELQGKIDGKLSKTGWSADKYLGTDSDGNVVEKEIESGGGGGSDIAVATVDNLYQGSPARYIIFKTDDMGQYHDVVLNATISGMFDGPYGSFENENVTIRLTGFYEPTDYPGYIEGSFGVTSETNSWLNNVAYGNMIRHKLSSIFDIATRINQGNKSEMKQEWLETIDGMMYVITEVSNLSFAETSLLHKSVTEGLITTEFIANYL